jgi:hypothetical protein
LSSIRDEAKEDLEEDANGHDEEEDLDEIGVKEINLEEDGKLQNGNLREDNLQNGKNHEEQEQEQEQESENGDSSTQQNVKTILVAPRAEEAAENNQSETADNNENNTFVTQNSYEVLD